MASDSHAAHATTPSSRYFVPAPSAWPFTLTIALILIVYGVSAYLEDRHLPTTLMISAGAALGAFIIFRWFRGVALESEGGSYNDMVSRTYRWGMSWFIFSEVMFFGAFFGALFYTRTISVPWLGGEGDKGISNILWPQFETMWPTNGPGHVGGAFETVSPWKLPLVNTVLLLTSSVTITFSHHALKENHRLACKLWLLATILLGATFLRCQAAEYIEAYREMNLTLGSGVYGSTFFMLTGFHGLHVTLGTFMMICILGRLISGHFKPESHFGFEGVAWYWHFVDVVWVGLFIFVYVL